jgi:hypothetical protein
MEYGAFSLSVSGVQNGVLGHKDIRNTLVYTHLVDFGSDEYVCKIAKTVDDAKVLVEDGFDYVTEGLKLFRKRK